MSCQSSPSFRLEVVQCVQDAELDLMMPTWGLGSRGNTIAWFVVYLPPALCVNVRSWPSVPHSEELVDIATGGHDILQAQEQCQMQRRCPPG